MKFSPNWMGTYVDICSPKCKNIPSLSPGCVFLVSVSTEGSGGSYSVRVPTSSLSLQSANYCSVQTFAQISYYWRQNWLLRRSHLVEPHCNRKSQCGYTQWKDTLRRGKAASHVTDWSQTYFFILKDVFLIFLLCRWAEIKTSLLTKWGTRDFSSVSWPSINSIYLCANK